MHPNEINLLALDTERRRNLWREAERLGPAHVDALEVQHQRQFAERAKQRAA